MNLQFSIEYKTYYGQELVLNIVNGKESGTNSVCQYRMHTRDGFLWTVEINRDIKPGTVVDYFYSVHVGDHEERRGWSVAPHRVIFNSAQALNYRIFDHWREIPDNAFLYSSAVTDCVVGAKIENLKLEKFSKFVCLKVRAPQLGVGDKLCLIGADPLMGSWKEKKAVKMTQVAINEWAACLDASQLASNKLEFKFAILNPNKEYSPMWENCNNRTIELPAMEEGDALIYELNEANFTLPPTRVAGTLVPLFSLRSDSSFGVGDFGDLKKMVDWVSLTQQRYCKFCLSTIPPPHTRGQTLIHIAVSLYSHCTLSMQTSTPCLP